MDVRDAILKRRAYRYIDPFEVTADLISDLAECAALAPSCYNRQPWNFVFVNDENLLSELKFALSSGNDWAVRSSLFVVVFTKKDLDCVITDREYALFDTGIATAHIMLRATELGLVAHPIAGYSPNRVRQALSIPEDMNVITMLVFGKQAHMSSITTEEAISESNRPERKLLEEFIHINKYGNTLSHH